jgi:hypothetical protein
VQRSSSASFVSLNSRTFSMAIIAWSANVFSSSICRSVNGVASVRLMETAPIASAPRSRGTVSTVRKP